jgi:hypothetical protein
MLLDASYKETKKFETAFKDGYEEPIGPNDAFQLGTSMKLDRLRLNVILCGFPLLQIGRSLVDNGLAKNWDRTHEGFVQRDGSQQKYVHTMRLQTETDRTERLRDVPLFLESGTEFHSDAPESIKPFSPLSTCFRSHPLSRVFSNLSSFTK